jgi:hypothetical protein
MKSIKPKILFSGAMLFFMLLSVSSFAQKMNFVNSTVVPSAMGSVKIDRDKNKNYNIDISIMHLTDPSRLTPSKKSYVVWIQTEYNGVKSIGRLHSASGFLSNTMKASLHAVTPLKPSKVFVTAEDYGDAQMPGSVIVLSTKSF